MIDFLVADRLAYTLMTAKIACNLFWRPRRLQASSYIIWPARALSATHATLAPYSLRNHRVITSKWRILIEMPIPLELAIVAG